MLNGEVYKLYGWGTMDEHGFVDSIDDYFTKQILFYFIYLISTDNKSIMVTKHNAGMYVCNFSFFTSFLSF